MDLNGYVSLFLLGISSLLPLVNPVGTALIISPYFQGVAPSDRKQFSFKISLSCFVLGLATLFLGSWCLRFMGISIPAIQLGGGLLITRMGLAMLSQKSDDKSDTAKPGKLEDSLFYPLAFPLTLGPGGISTLITLSAHAHADDTELTLLRMGVLSGSLLAVMIVTYFCFSYSDQLIRRIGPSGSIVMNRLMAFLVFCIGIQMIIGGLEHSFPRMFG